MKIPKLSTITLKQKKILFGAAVAIFCLVVLAIILGGGSDLVGSQQDNVEQVELQE